MPPWDLGLDSTVAYVKNKYIYDLTQSDLNVKSPYNTTKHPGLPPGPIDSPDLTAIQAVLHPAPRRLAVLRHGEQEWPDAVHDELGAVQRLGGAS